LRAALEPLLARGTAARREPSEIDQRIADLVPRFVEVCLQGCAELRQALAEERWSAAGTIGHTLRGAGGGYGFDEVTQIGRAIQEAADAHDSAGLSALAERLEAHLGAFKKRYSVGTRS
jgi:HPt (histidine-containing phosphotransfer) domain-containing protein